METKTVYVQLRCGSCSGGRRQVNRNVHYTNLAASGAPRGRWIHEECDDCSRLRWEPCEHVDGPTMAGPRLPLPLQERHELLAVQVQGHRADLDAYGEDITALEHGELEVRARVQALEASVVELPELRARVDDCVRKLTHCLGLVGRVDTVERATVRIGARVQALEASVQFPERRERLDERLTDAVPGPGRALDQILRRLQELDASLYELERAVREERVNRAVDVRPRHGPVNDPLNRPPRGDA